MTKSKHHKWQTRWTVSGGKARHETGLIVVMPDDQPEAANADEVRQTLAVKNGHNAAAMVARLLREGTAMLSSDTPRLNKGSQ